VNENFKFQQSTWYRTIDWSTPGLDISICSYTIPVIVIYTIFCRRSVTE